MGKDRSPVSNDSSVRLFIAAQLPEELRTALGKAAVALRHSAHTIRLTGLHNLHLTLCFLGEVPPAKAAEISAWFRLLPALTEEERMAHIIDYGEFPGRGGQTLWAGLSVTQSMMRLAHDLARGGRELGIPLDNRTFVPHVTLARDARLMRPLSEISPALPRTQPAALQPIMLFQSSLTKSGMLYTPLEKMGE